MVLQEPLKSMYDLGNQIADQEYIVYGSRLTGYGTYYENMENATYQEWIRDFKGGLEKLEETRFTIL